MRLSNSLMVIFAGFLLSLPLRAVAEDYTIELRGQINEVKKQFPQPRPEYFHDMGIIARKADDAAFSELTAEILRDLLKKMDLFIQTQMDEINEQYEKDAFQASRRFQDLNKVPRYFQPTEDFSKTALGQAINMELIQFRANVLEDLHKNCSMEAVVGGVQALQKSGLFITGSVPEIEALRKINEAMTCCASWKSEIVLNHTQDFESLYEKGTVSEEARLRLESSRADLTQAKWVGDWAHRYTGRDGKGEGMSQGVLIYHKGGEFATLAISTPRVSSTGRMNFPDVFSGEKRTLVVEGKPLDPQINFHGKKLNMTGCRSETKTSEVV